MIFVTLGTQDKPFNRLLEAIDREIECGNIKEKVVVQAGFTKYKSKNMEIFDLIDRENFEKLINSCDVLITHGGVGSIMTGLNHNKKIIVAPRLARYGEHLNDHQLQITDNFSKEGYVLKLEDYKQLGNLIKEAKSFVPKKYVSNSNNMIDIICEFIDNN